MRASRIFAVIGLSALLGSGWLLTEAYPGEMVFPFAGCVHFAVIGLTGLVGALRTGWNRKKTTSVAAAGLAVFVLPGVVGAFTAGAVSGSARGAMFCAAPLFIVLGMAWFGDSPGDGLMVPSLVGLLGALLIFTVEIPRSTRSALGMAAVLASCVAVAAASVWMFKLMQGLKLPSAIAAIGIAGAALLGGYGLWMGWPAMPLSALGVEALRCVVFDLPLVWITVWLMREVRPARLAARFLAAPAATWLEGYALVRGPVEPRSLLALALLAAGAGMLLMKDEADTAPGLGLR